MKVSDLLKLLENANPDQELILSSDPEGNSYSPLTSVAEVLYVEEESGGAIFDNWGEFVEWYGEDEEYHPAFKKVWGLWP